MGTSSWWGWLDGAGFCAIRTLVSVFWQSTILFVAIGLLVHILRRVRARVKHVLWAFALFVTPALPLVTWAALVTGTPHKGLAVLPVYAAPRPEAPPEGTPALSRDAAPPSAAENAAAFAADGVIRAASTESDSAAAERPSPGEYRWALAVMVYAAGLGFFVSLVIFGRLGIRRWRVEGTPVVDTRVLETFGRVRDRLGVAREVDILENANVPAPLVIGAFRPAVLLPKGMARSLSDTDLDAMALHEMAHVKRNDSLVLTLASLVRAVFFFHPGVWFVARRVSTFAEQAADDGVLEVSGRPLPYARMLARLAELLPRRAFSTEVAAGIVLAKSAFLCRVEAILRDREDVINRLSGRGAAAVVLGALAAVVAAAGLPLVEMKGPPYPPSVETSQSKVCAIGRACLMAMCEGDYRLGPVRSACPEGADATREVAAIGPGNAELVARRPREIRLEQPAESAELLAVGTTLTAGEGFRWLALDDSIEWHASDILFVDTNSDGGVLEVRGDGEPIVATVEARECWGWFHFQLVVKGRLGEPVRINRNGGLPSAPKLRITSEDGSYDRVLTFLNWRGKWELLWRKPAELTGSFTATVEIGSPFEIDALPLTIKNV